MRAYPLPILILLTSCGANKDEQAKKIIQTVANDPASVLVRDTRSGKPVGGDESLCGEFNAKNALGGYGQFQDFVTVGSKVAVSTGAYGRDFSRSLSDRKNEAQYRATYDVTCANEQERRQYAKDVLDDQEIERQQRKSFDEAVKSAEGMEMRWKVK